jgi:hypothetical protein
MTNETKDKDLQMNQAALDETIAVASLSSIESNQNLGGLRILGHDSGVNSSMHKPLPDYLHAALSR